MNQGNYVSKSQALKIALSMHEGEPCRICGVDIDNAKLAVFAGYSKNCESRLAHNVCWSSGIPKSKWVYPEDE